MLRIYNLHVGLVFDFSQLFQAKEIFRNGHLRYSATMTGTRFRLGFRYSAQEGLFLAKFTTSCSMYSLEYNEILKVSLLLILFLIRKKKCKTKALEGTPVSQHRPVF